LALPGCAARRVAGGALHGIDRCIGGRVRAVAALRRSPQPVVLRRRHEHELAASMPGYLHRLALRFVPEPTELALELQGADGWHGGLPN